MAFAESPFFSSASAARWSAQDLNSVSANLVISSSTAFTCASGVCAFWIAISASTSFCDLGFCASNRVAAAPSPTSVRKILVLIRPLLNLFFDEGIFQALGRRLPDRVRRAFHGEGRLIALQRLLPVALGVGQPR